jgi:hypothetical protein
MHKPSQLNEHELTRAEFSIAICPYNFVFKQIAVAKKAVEIASIHSSLHVLTVRIKFYRRFSITTANRTFCVTKTKNFI